MCPASAAERVSEMGASIVLMCFLCCGYGLLLIFAKDTAWNYVSWRNRNRGLASERTAQWDSSATFQGVALIVIGLGLLFFLPGSSARHRTRGPVIGTSTLTIDGRPATPAEQEMFRQEMPGGKPHPIPPNGSTPAGR